MSNRITVLVGTPLDTEIKWVKPMPDIGRPYELSDMPYYIDESEVDYSLDDNEYLEP